MRILKCIGIIAFIIAIILFPLSCVLDNSHIRLWGNFALVVGHAITLFLTIKEEKEKKRRETEDDSVS